MSKKENAVGTKTEMNPATPLLVFASILSIASLGWTTYSLLDLMAVGAIGLTVAITADLIWSSVIWCEYKNIGTPWIIKTIGWIAVCVVGGFIGWHGVAKDNIAMAVAGPFLTIGTKAVWEFALWGLKDAVRDLRKESSADIALLNATTDTIIDKAAAEIRREDAEQEAAHNRVLAEKRRKHELRMAELSYEADEKRAISAHRADLVVGGIENAQFDKMIGIIERQNASLTIEGETVPRNVTPRNPRPSISGTAIPSTQTGPRLLNVTIHDGPLTEAQEGRRRTAALYYLYEDECLTQNIRPTQSAFAAKMNTNKVAIGRATKEFPRDTFEDITEYADCTDSEIA